MSTLKATSRQGRSACSRQRHTLKAHVRFLAFVELKRNTSTRTCHLSCRMFHLKTKGLRVFCLAKTKLCVKCSSYVLLLKIAMMEWNALSKIELYGEGEEKCVRLASVPFAS